jgi:curved DNA-binding protein CbpA
MAGTDYYAALGVERTATDAEIKKAFRRLAQQWHPDVSSDPAAAERFKDLNEAYQVLSDPERRQRYDMFGAAGVEADVAAGFGGMGGFADIFDAFFGGAAGAARRGRPVRPPDHVRGGGPGHGEGDRVPGPRAVRDLRRQRRQARDGGDDLSAVQGPGRGPDGSPDDARPDGQRHDLSPLPR